jgi:hypothetical protein
VVFIWAKSSTKNLQQQQASWGHYTREGMLSGRTRVQQFKASHTHHLQGPQWTEIQLSAWRCLRSYCLSEKQGRTIHSIQKVEPAIKKDMMQLYPHISMAVYYPVTALTHYGGSKARTTLVMQYTQYSKTPQNQKRRRDYCQMFLPFSTWQQKFCLSLTFSDFCLLLTTFVIFWKLLSKIPYLGE